MKKLAIIITHPIQYYVPLFQILAQNCNLKVFYTWGAEGANAKYDPDFKKIIDWDVPLLAGYTYQFLSNVAKKPGSHHYSGIVNPSLNKEIEHFLPDAILIYGWAYQSHLNALRKFKSKIPIWFRGDSNLIDSQNGIKPILRGLFLKWIYGHVDKAFYVGSANKNYYLKFGMLEKQLIFAPHAVDNDRFANDRKAEAETLRQKLNIAPDEVLILFAGKLEPKKDPELLLKAFLISENEKVHLLFVGNGILENTLKKQYERDASTSLIMTNVHFMDFQNQTQMPVIYQACDLFCLPSQGPGETWGLAVNEAMASSKAILVSDKVGCATDLVKYENNGYIFESGNVKDLQSKLSLVTTSKEKLTEMGQQSAALIKNWTIAQQAKTILKELNN